MTAAIRTVGLGKQYRVGARPAQATLRESLTRSTRRLLRGEARPKTRTFWALRNVALEIPRGGTVGLIGGNGAGKSTLLKILSRITGPTTGRVELRGRVGALLEVGAGFHPELTGRENIYLSSAILGMSHRDLSRRFDAIVDFSGVAPFLDHPVKHFSSGMYLRLAFAVAAHLEPDVLLVDEVLAVGDAEFQRKCLGKMEEVAGDGRTVVLVSHNMDAILRLCRSAVLLNRGEVVASGHAHEVVRRYVAATADSKVAPNVSVDLSDATRSGSGDARFIAASVESDAGGAGQPYTGGPLTATLTLDARIPCIVSSLALSVLLETGVKLVNADIVQAGQVVRLRPGRNVVRLHIDALNLNPGTYVVDLWAGQTVGSGFDYVPSAFRIDVWNPSSRGVGMTPFDNGVVPCRCSILTDN